MTILATFQDPSGAVWIGSDGRVMCNGIVERDDSSKWEIDAGGAWAVGVAGYLGVLQIAAAEAEAQYGGTQIGLGSQGEAAHRFAECMRRRLNEIGWAAESSRGDAPRRDQDLVLLMGGRIWDVDLGLGIAIPMAHGLWCWGSGSAYGLGAGYAAIRDGWTPEQIVRVAVQAAVRYDPGCGGEPWIRRI